MGIESVHLLSRFGVKERGRGVELRSLYLRKASALTVRLLHVVFVMFATNTICSFGRFGISEDKCL
jgi:hypothetical protein